MIINDAGRRLIMEAESLRLEAYLCPAGIPTIGYGHTGDVRIGDRITEHQAEVILEYDLFGYERGVTALAPKLNANQFSALVSFAFNCGLEALEKSTLLKEANAGRILNAANEFRKWVHATTPKGEKIVLPGLVKRRAAERALFLQVPS